MLPLQMPRLVCDSRVESNRARDFLDLANLSYSITQLSHADIRDYP